MTAIKTQGLCKSYQGKPAVDKLDLTVEEGELFALLGVNGAGKSTIIKMLSCLTKPTAGDAWLLGDSVTAQTAKVKENINVSPQETAVAPNLSVRENLELMAGIHGAPHKEARKKAAAFIGAFQFEEIARQRAKTLSGGWQRRLSIAMALISQPKILFLDEPTLGLDVLARRELWRVIEQLKGSVTIVLTTHYLEEAEALSDRIGILAKGKLREVGTAKELMQKTNAASLEDAFVTLAQEDMR